MTTKDAILALAAKVAGTAQDNVATTAQALNKLAYAATGQAPTTDLMTVDDCIAFITANYSGGGGVDVGALVDVMYRSGVTPQPAVGDAVNLTPIYDVAIIKIGDATIMDVTSTGSGIQSDVGWASGVTLTTIWMPAYSDPAEDAAFAFIYTVETVEEVDYYKTVTILQDAVTMETMNDGDPMKRYTFTVPAVDEGTYFAVAYVGDWE